jgi:hypothetical protein
MLRIITAMIAVPVFIVGTAVILAWSLLYRLCAAIDRTINQVFEDWM